MNILLVDDDIPTMDLILSSIDWTAIGIEKVHTAYSISPAKQILLNNSIDLVISDIEMPKGSGLELLQWIREQGIPTEFVLLTCHEKFEYAATAIKMEVMEYILKPFDPEIMKLTIRRCAQKIARKKEEQSRLEIGDWHLRNLARDENAFWLSLLNTPSGDLQTLRAEIAARGLLISADEAYCLIVTRITDYETKMQEMGNKLFVYFLKSLYAEKLFRRDESPRTVIRLEETDAWIIAAAESSPELERSCVSILSQCEQTLHLQGTCCIGQPRPLTELASGFLQIQKIMVSSVAHFGGCFREEQAQAESGEQQILNLQEMENLLLRKDKRAILNEIKREMDIRSSMRRLNEHTLHTLRKEVTQAVYAHMLREGMQVTRAVGDEAFDRLADNACRSPMDLIRWANYLLERTFQSLEELSRTDTLVERINAYISHHYAEPLSRDGIAAAFHLTPQYLAKLYSKKTGKFLMDFLREYRLEQAKKLLISGDMPVSEVAMNTGFDNFSYFSTLFKKETGMSPQQYRTGNRQR